MPGLGALMGLLESKKNKMGHHEKKSQAKLIVAVSVSGLGLGLGFIKLHKFNKIR